jgi:uncharacterized protein DUF4255
LPWWTGVPNYEAIGDVSRTLEAFLTAQLTALPGPPIAQLHDLAAPPSTSPPVLTLFLYDVVEDGSARNRPPTRTPVQIGGQQRVTVAKPSMTLILRYMVTAWAADRVSEHRMIGRAIQSFYDHATLSGPQLVGTLANTSEALRLTLAPITLEERALVWDAINQPYRLSVNYEVRVIHIDSELALDLPGVTEAIVQPARVERVR